MAFLATMNSHHSPKEEELRRREEALKERELQIRLRELEAELEPTPVTPTRKHQEESRPQPKPPWYQRLPNWLKFIVVVLGVLVAIRIAAWLASVVLVLAVSWVAYKLFLESQD
ncbi:MAG: A24 family peptidase [Cyanobacteria bacterium P01_G01_bin.54]